jgi:hypothetical protein
LTDFSSNSGFYCESHGHSRRWLGDTRTTKRDRRIALGLCHGRKSTPIGSLFNAKRLDLLEFWAPTAWPAHCWWSNVRDSTASDEFTGCDSPTSVLTHVAGDAFVPDFAFADTVSMSTFDLDDLPPSSGPAIVNDSFRQTQKLSPLTYPLPPTDPMADPMATTRTRVPQSNVSEMRELWDATLHMVAPTQEHTPATPTERALVLLRRVLALWQFWEWERTDIARGAMIGMAVFLLIAIAWVAGASHFTTR